MMTATDLGAILKSIAPVIRDELAKRDAQIALLSARVLELENTALKDRGIWKPGTAYRMADVVTRAGGAWVCTAAHVAKEQFDHAAFRLQVKSGQRT